MYKDFSMTLAIPAYSAQESMANAISNLPEWIDEIIIIDDCSFDGTCQLVEKWSYNKFLMLKN